MIRRILVLALAATLSGAAASAYSQSFMTRHVRDAVRNGQARSFERASAKQVMQLDLVLPLRDQAGLKSFLSDVYNPSSPNYRHFLTVSEFTEQFGPTQEDYDAVLRFAQNYGLDVIGGSRDAMDVQVKGTVAAIELAFHTDIRTYRHPSENRQFYGPDREPTIDLPFKLWHVSGLDNYSTPRPLLANKHDYAAREIRTDAVLSNATTGSGSGPSGSFLGSDMRAAYYGSGTLTGAGQTLGLVEFYGTELTDLNTYFNNVGQTNTVPITLLSTDGTSTSCIKAAGCDDTEQTLDMTQAIGMAPGLASLAVYVGSTDTAIISSMTSHNPLPTTISCSWGWIPADPSALDPYFQRMAAQGQSFFAASGDNSTWSQYNEAWPADDAYVVSVGGTSLVTAGAAGAWKSETAWAYSGGGISPDNITIPSWQKLAGVINSSNKASTTLRNGPDVSANADFDFYVCADQRAACTTNLYGGTSFAAPMWAAYMALVNQQLAQQGQRPIGFLNPTIYAQNVTSSYAADFHDIVSGTSGSYSAIAGYDLVTGWGSPNSGLLTALTGGAQSSSFSISGTSVSVTQGSSGSSTINVSPVGSFTGAVTLAALNPPTGVTVASPNPVSISGGSAASSTLTLNVAPTVAPGTYSITVQGTAGTTVQTTTVTLIVMAALPEFSMSASTPSITISRRSHGSVTIASSVAGGFNSAIELSAAGQGPQNLATFSPSSITGQGSSTMTIYICWRAALGTHIVTVTGKSGSTTRTTTFNLTVTN